MNYPKILPLYKSVGISPLDAIKEYKKKNPEYENVKMGYAGRLDPMAEGVLLVMVGEENKNKDKYLSLDKEYEVQMVLGIETDSYDVLGKVVDSTESQVAESKIKKAIQQYSNLPAGRQGITIKQSYPPYSSQTINGERMYKLARENRLDKAKIPSKKIKINSIKIDEITTIEKEKVQLTIDKKLAKVIGNFRQDDIKQSWSDYFSKSDRNNYQLITFTISCSSGTYIRSLVNDVGCNLSTGAFVYNLVRTKVGKYSIEESVFVIPSEVEGSQ